MRIHIEQLTFDTIIGILPHERQSPQRVIFDVTIDYHYQKGVFIDYAEICEFLETQMRLQRFHLLEEALEKLTKLLFQHYPDIKSLELKILKPDILSQARVGVSLKKTRN